MTTTTSTRTWIRRFTARRESGTRLYCFPFAGGSAGAYRPWAEFLPEDFELGGIQLPGRQERFSEAPHTDLRELVPLLADAVEQDLDGRPYVLFGHSMGTLLAYETALELRRRGTPAPAVLAVSGRRAPQVTNDQPLYHLMPDSALVDRLEELGGTAPELSRNQGFLEFILPTLRADFTVVETYRHDPAPALDCPVLVFGGTGDRYAPLPSLRAWSELTSAETAVHTFPGGHFFLWDHARDIIDAIIAGVHHER